MTAYKGWRWKWLERHPELWGMPHRDLVNEMKRRGIYAPSTYYKDTMVEKFLTEKNYGGKHTGI